MKTRPMKACLEEQWYRLFLSLRSQRSSQCREELSGKADWEDRTLARS